ncbi:MAG: hypothetical protein NVS4B10_01280 [Myxococcales bacterium]
MNAAPLEPRRGDTQRLIVLALLAGAAFLLAEVRFEHREVLGETWRAWIPLVWAAALLVLGGAALARFQRGGRAVLTGLFALSAAVGALGIWFHSNGHPLRRILQVLAAWALQPGQDGGIKLGSQPPALAPAAFCGLGLIGLLACRKPP